VWKALPARGFPNYPSGSWGPTEADDLMERDGRAWRDIEAEEFGAKCPAATETKHA
jgi:glucose-6-phosphate 1-dehydrogenase